MPALRLTTAGESHGKCVVAVLEGLPAGLRVATDRIDEMLARRQQGYGRGGRMKIESDRVEVLSGLRRDHTLGSPLALQVVNRDHTLEKLPPATRPRPGHADLPGMYKYGTRDARDVLERASARETAARVAAGAVAAQLNDLLGVRVAGYVVSVGEVAAGPAPADLDEAVRLRNASPFFCPDPGVTEAMKAAVDAAQADGDTLGGLIEIRATGMPPGIGGFANPDERLDGRLAAALMRVQAMKGVEIGMGFLAAQSRGSAVHDEILPDSSSAWGTRRHRNNAGGIEGGMTTGEEIVVRVAMKPISTLRRALRSVDMETGEAVEAAHERSDTCAVPAASVICEAVVDLVLADALLEKTGGDSVEEVRRNLDAYRAACGGLLPPSGGG